MEMRLETLRKRFSEANPEIISLKNQIAASRQRLQQEEEKAIEKYNKQFGLTKFAAEVAFNQQLYSSLVSKQEELKAQYIMQNKSPEIIERAIESLYPSKPKRKLIFMLGAVLGLFLGLGSALFWEFLDNSIHTAQDVTKFFDLPVLGIIPRLREIKKNPEENALITYHDMNSPRGNRAMELYKESYRMLQLEVAAAANGKVENAAGVRHQGGLTLLVTSSVAKEGKSIVATNLAISIAQTGRKVLLVDADYRSSIQHKLLDLNVQKGLLDFLAGSAAWSDIAKNTSLNSLYAITSGGSNSQTDPSALFISSCMEDFIKLSRQQFDVIIFDSSPATLASESAAIGSKADAIVLVIKANDTKKDIILQAKQRMQNSGGKILGAVLNCAV